MNPTVEVILHNLIPVVASLLLLLVPIFVKWLTAFLEKKFNFELDAAKQQQLIDLLDHGIAHAEEWANAQTTGTQPPPPSADKLNKAFAFVADEIKRTGLDVLTEQKIKDLLTARLGLKRDDAPTTV